MKLTLTIPDEIANEVLDAFKQRFIESSVIEPGEESLHENLDPKKALADFLYRYIEKITKQHIQIRAEKEAKEKTKNAIEKIRMR